MLDYLLKRRPGDTQEDSPGIQGVISEKDARGKLSRIEELKNEIIEMNATFINNDINLEKDKREIWAEAIGTGEEKSKSYLDPVEQIEKSNRETKRLKTQ